MNAIDLIGPLAGLALGGACGWLLGRGQSGAARPGQSPELTLPEPPPLPPRPDPDDPTAADRKRLVDACIDVGDRLRTVSPALWQKLERALAEAGIEPVGADGEQFDPDRHHAVGNEPTTDPAQDLRVVTDLPGYTDRGAPLRRPQVVVYRLAGGAA